MHHQTPDIVEVPRCPRCDYDQRGAVASWTDSCPVAGVCPECGYGFVWTDVMRPYRQRCPGFFEHVRGPIRSLRAAWRTLAWALLPMVFWSRVRMHHEVRVRRLLLFPAVAFGSIWSLVFVLRVSAFFLDGSYFRGSWEGMGAEVANMLIWPAMMLDWYAGPPGTGGSLWVTWMVDDWSPMYAGLFGQALLVPLLLLALPVTRKRAKIRKVHVLRAAVYGQSWIAIHLGVLLASALLGAVTAEYNTAMAWDGPVLDALYEYPLAYGVALGAWIALWWWYALHRGFAMPQATRHWALLMLAAVLVFVLGLIADWRVAMQMMA